MDFENQNMETKKSGKGGIIGICVAAVIVLLAVAAALVYTFVYNTPQRKLTKAFEKLGREFAGSESSFLEELKIEDILANARKILPAWKAPPILLFRIWRKTVCLIQWALILHPM